MIDAAEIAKTLAPEWVSQIKVVATHHFEELTKTGGLDVATEKAPSFLACNRAASTRRLSQK